MEENELFKIADKYLEARDKKQIAEETLRAIAQQVEELEFELIQGMTDNELDNFKRNGTQFTVARREYISPVPERKDELYQAMKDNGFENLFTINANTLSGTVKELTKENEEVLPEWLDGLVQSYEKQSIRIKRS